MSGRTPLHDVAVVGAYNTRQAKKLDATEIDVLLDAVHGAVASAGMSIDQVDGFNVTSTMQRYTAREAVMLFGARPCWTKRRPPGSRIGDSMVSTMCCIMWALNSAMP